MRRYFAIVLLLLVGCTTLTPEQRAERNAARAQRAQEQNQQRAQRMLTKHSPYCEAAGFQKGTPEFAQCIIYRSEAEANRAQQNYNAMMQQNRSTSTNCTSFGNTISCTSY